MSFSDRQLRMLQRSVPANRLRTRVVNGKEISYIEGWYAISEANRIFGLDAWDRETFETRCVLARDVRGNFTAIYTAKVRVTVRTAGASVVREGHGIGEGRGGGPIEAHEMAMKAAETDATKRALSTFGKPFGLALYAAPRVGVRRTQNAISAEAPEAVSQRSAASHVVPIRTPPQTPADTPTTHIPHRIDKSVLTIGHPRRERDRDHLLFVGRQPCLLCGRAPSDAHHLRFAQQSALGRKVGDQFTVPLCRAHHRQLHQSGDESAWWTDLEINAVEIANGLWEESRMRRGRSQPDDAAVTLASTR